jgi:ATP adenylyltransferase
MGDLTPDEWAELMGLVQDAVAALQHAVHCQGFNIGLNIGRCAGAGLPEHLHIHVVPRWSGDTNFMPVFGQVRVIPQAIEAVREKLLEAGEELGLPRAGR